MRSRSSSSSSLSRRHFLHAISALPLLACGGSSGSSGQAPGQGGASGTDGGGPSVNPDGGAGSSLPFETPQLLQTMVTRQDDGTFVRTFSGPAAPQDLEVTDEAGVTSRLHDLFPRSNCPFGINTKAELGAGGYKLATPDRMSTGELPPPVSQAPAWALNMIPFGVAIDGVLIDPSGPWYDGGPADPQNPFDRACSGWEYDPIFKTVAELVGVPSGVRGHVQPGPGGVKGSLGLFHYHGVPRLMLENLRRSLSEAARREPLLTGYSADGFPILDAIVPSEASLSGKRLHLFSGYLLKTGARVAGLHTNAAKVPSGEYDGTYVQDWTYDPTSKRALIDEALRQHGVYEGLSSDDVASGRAEIVLLDERNGLIATDRMRLKEANGQRAYAYVMTPDWPEVPRWLAYQPSESFRSVIPLQTAVGMGPPGRDQLYGACTGGLADVHQWNGRAPY